MVYVSRRLKRSMRRYAKSKLRRPKRMSNKRSTRAIAKNALALATQIANSTTETKYLSYAVQTDLAGSAGTDFNEAFSRQLTSTASTTPLFNTDPLNGNKAYCKHIKATWEIHHDNVNSEEETVNYTLAVVRLRQDLDSLPTASHVSVIQGQAYYDPRMYQILYYKHFTLTMGGGSGVTGTPNRSGSFYIPVKRMIRFVNEGAGGTQTNTTPASYQDRLFFVVHTDNSSADTESPRLNFRSMTVWKDSDINA